MRRRFLYVGLLIVLFLITGLPAAAGLAWEPLPWPIWREEVLVGGVDLRTLAVPSLALDADGRPHIVYGNKRLLHAWLDGNTWRSEVVDTTHISARRSVLAIDPAGTLRIADAVGEQVILRTRQEDGSWAVEKVPLPGQGTIAYLSLAVDSAGGLHLVAVPSTGFYRGTLVYARRVGQEDWTAEKLDAPNPVAGSPVLVLDSQERPVILFGQRDAPGYIDILWLMRQTGAGWQREQLATGYLIIGKALALDDQDQAYALFSDHHGGELTYVYRGASAWQTMQVTDYGVYPAMLLDNAGRPHIVYGTEWGQAYAVLHGEEWQTTAVQEQPYAGWFNTMVRDQAGALHITSLATNLHYATNKSGSWQVSMPAKEEQIGLHNALALDTSGTVQALYYEPEHATLYWGQGNAETWQGEPLAVVAEQDLALAVAVDTQDRPHIAYIDSVENKLFAGVRQEGVWKVGPVGQASQQLALATGSDDRTHLLSVQAGKLIYRWRVGEIWHAEPVAGPNDHVLSATLALDSADRPHVAYTGSGGSVYAIREVDGSWTVETLPFQVVVGLALDSEDRPTFLHSRAVWAGNPKYPFFIVTLYFGEKVDGFWQEHALESDEVLAMSDPVQWEGDAEIVAAAGGQVHIALRTPANRLQYAWRDEAGRWYDEFGGAWIYGDIGLAIGPDGQPRVLYHDDNSLVLATREIMLLGEASRLPVVAR